eukprot:CAMPEP_0182437222 /NCGR_PEP_ID=MMETSP1167-20130531/84899_1 /TAXON_ID=2988 /ORGANISM="Mallomonas Sp, Strain CCMP3275" /LENGTH=447 /DNA_ID=CAMNT_0024630061 /DNA_START=1092 /DNA_END=2435 /DNA_ORIENTATION=-
MLQERVNNLLRNWSDVEERIELDIRPLIDQHIQGRISIARTIHDIMSKDDKIETLLPPPSIGSLDDNNNYHLVFRVTEKTLSAIEDDKNKEIGMYRKGPTVYGPGVRLELFTKDNLAHCDFSSEGTLQISIGLAYFYRIKTITPPFRVTEDKAAKKRASATSMKMVKSGYDCIEVSLDDTEASEHVYWVPGTVVPLEIVTIKKRLQCSICMEKFFETEGYNCENHHFICWESCFEGYIQSASEPGAIGRSIDTDGNLKCPECNELIDLQRVANHANEGNSFNALVELKLKINSEKALKAGLEEQEKRLKAEFDRIQRITDVNEKEAMLTRMSIIEDILTLKCPACKNAFNDFDGCFALTCNAHCRAGFCAWCLAHCGNDAHAHVLQCPHKPGHVQGYHGTKQDFDEHHRIRRERMVREQVSQKSPEVRVILKRVLIPDLRDLGITLE